MRKIIIRKLLLDRKIIKFFRQKLYERKQGPNAK